MNYPAELYEQTRPGIQASARVVVPELVRRFNPATVLDVGCGEGWWVREFEQLGCEAAGIDKNAGERFVAHDLEQPLASAPADLVLCLEVAEHISEGRAPGLVADLCAIAPTVVFSAAIPGQGGAGHINEQWPGYWVELFAAHGYKGSGTLRHLFWNDSRIEPWYRQNLLVFGDLGGLPEDGCDAVVHPDIWAWYR